MAIPFLSGLQIATGSHDEIVFTGSGGAKILAPVEMYLDASNDIYLMSHSSVNLTLGNNTATFAGDVGIKKAGANTLLYLQNTASVTSGNRGDIAFYNSDTSTVGLIRATAVTDNVGTELEFYTRPANGSLTKALTIDSSNNGIFSNKVFVNQGSDLTTQALQVNGFIDITDVTATALRWYNGSTFRGGLGLDSWAHGTGNDSDITMYISGDNSFFVSTNNVKRLEIDSSSAEFTGQLIVSGTTQGGYQSQIINASTGDDANGLLIQAGSSATEYALKVADQPGTTTLFDVRGNGAATFGGSVDAINYKINGAQGSDGQVLTSTGSGVAWETPSTGTTFTGGTVANATTFSSAVGIGAAAASGMLDVKGADTDNAVIARFYSNTGARGRFIIRNGSGTNPTTFIGTGGGSEQLSIGTNNTEAIRLDASQNATFAGTILINGVSNYTGLEVKGSGASRPSIQFSNVTQGDLGQIYGTENNALVIGTGTSSNAAVTLNSNQTVNFHNSVYFSGSNVGLISWGSMGGGTGFGIRGESGRALSLGAGGSWDHMIINTSGAATFAGDATISGGDLTVGSTTNNGTVTIRSLDSSSSTRTAKLKFNIAGTDTTGFTLHNNTSGIAANTLIYDVGGTEKVTIYGDGHIRTVNNVTAQIFRDQDNTAYYLDASNASTSLNAAGTATFAGTGTSSFGGDLRMLSGSNGTTAKIIFKRPDNASVATFIRTNAYWNEYGAHANEGHKFVDSSGNILLQLNGGNSTSGNGAKSATFIGDVVISSSGTGNSPALRINNLNHTTFNHGIEVYNGNLVQGESEILLVGKTGSTKNSGYLGYYWHADGSDDNFVTIGHYANNHLLRVYGSGTVLATGNMQAPIFYDSDNTSYFLNPGSNSTVYQLYAGTTGADQTYNIRLESANKSSIGFHDSGSTIGAITFSGTEGFRLGANQGSYGPHQVSAMDDFYVAKEAGDTDGQSFKGYRLNKATSSSWTEGGTGNQTGWYGGNFNGSEITTKWVTGPHGERTLAAETTGDTNNDYDGGYVKAINNLDINKAHLSYVYIKRLAGTTGSVYHGTGAGTNQITDLSGNSNTNPYFHYPNLGSFPLNVWCISIGVIQANNDSNTTSLTGSSDLQGVYRCDTGQKIMNSSNFWKLGSAGSSLSNGNRFFHYYSTDASAKLQWAKPGFFEINGDEPSLAELLTGGGSRGLHTNGGDVTANRFYDWANTAYYIDPASLSQMHTIDFNGAVSGTTIGGAQIGRNHAYDTLELKGYGAELMIGAQHTEININYRTCNNNTSSHTPTTWKWRAGASNNWSNHYFGAVTSNGILTATTDVRAPSFADSDDTTYYLNPAAAGTSLNIKGKIQQFCTDGNIFLGINHSGNENWEFKCESASGSTDFISIGANGGDKVKIYEDGKFEHKGLQPTTGTSVDQIKEFSMTFQLAANTWTDTGINATDLVTGTYAVQVYVDDYGVGGDHYTEYYSGMMSWYEYNTNNTSVDELVLHRAGHAPNNGDIQLRTERVLSADTNDLMLQVKHNLAYNAALDNSTGKSMRFKFRRLI